MIIPVLSMQVNQNNTCFSAVIFVDKQVVVPWTQVVVPWTQVRLGTVALTVGSVLRGTILIYVIFIGC